MFEVVNKRGFEILHLSAEKIKDILAICMKSAKKFFGERADN